MAMIFLEEIHPAVKNATNRILSGENNVPYTCVRDFDGCEHYVTVVEDEAAEDEEKAAEEAGDDGSIETKISDKTIFVSLKHTVDLAVLDKFGNLKERLKAAVPDKGILLKEPEDASFICTCSISTKKNKDDYEALLDKAASLRCAALSAPFFGQFEAYLTDPTSVKPLVVGYRATESMYLYSAKGNFYCTMSVTVPDRDDQLFTRNFLQTFQDAKKLEKSISGAPGISYSIGKAPMDLPKTLLKEPESDEVFWVTFQLFKKQMEKPVDAQKTVTSLANFRNYVSYHIRCCRSNMHAKMRSRVETSMQILNRATTSTTGRAKVQIK